MAVIINEMPNHVPDWLIGAKYEADFACSLPYIHIHLPNGATAKKVTYRGRKQVDLAQCMFDALASSKKIDGSTSDGYHISTFDELYHYRMLYNAAFFNGLKLASGSPESGQPYWFDVHKSKRHSDGEVCFGGGWFVVVAQLPTGQITNHYSLKYWDLFDVPERNTAAEWDGHAPADVADRLERYLRGDK